jgi:predicted Zn-dependent protease
MKPYQYLQGFILLFIILISFFGCATNPVTGERQLMLMTDQMEIDWGNSVYPNALWGEVGGGGIYQDPELKHYLEKIVKRLHAVSHRPGLPVDFVIQNSSVPNAWAIPGHVSMTRGLLSDLENEAQFSFIMGHEMGHVAARHSAAQISRSILVQAGLATIGVALDSKKGSEWILGAGAVGANLFLLKYSRDQEFQADRLGTMYMARAGYNPYESIKAHQRLDRISDEYLKRMGKQSREGSFLDELLSTHPPIKDRINTIKETITTMMPYSITGDGKNADYFQQMISRIRHTNQAYLHYDSALKDYREDRIGDAENNLNKAFQMDTNQAPFYNLRGLIEIRKNRVHDARTNFQKALDIDRTYQPSYHCMGFSYYLDKNYQAALSYLKKSLALYPDSIASHYFTGMSYFKLKNYRDAITHLEKYASADPKHAEIHGVLGICLEETNNINSAYNKYRKQVEVAPDNEMGRHSAERIKILEQKLKKK